MIMMTMQEWCEALATVIWSTRQHVKDLERLRSSLPDSSTPPVRLTDQSELSIILTDQSQVTTQQLSTEVTELLSSLVTGTFIIEKQPPQVISSTVSGVNNTISAPGDEDQHQVHRHREAAGGRPAQRAHGLAPGQRQHHLRGPGQQPPQGE